MPLGKQGLLTGFHDSYMAGTLVEDCEHMDHPSTGHTDQNKEKVCKTVSRDKVQFCRLVSHMEYAIHFKARLEHTANLCKVLLTNMWKEKQFLAAETWLWSLTFLTHPVLAPYDFSLFLRMKSQLKGHHFKDVPAI
jgi:hypothetical protein